LAVGLLQLENLSLSCPRQEVRKSLSVDQNFVHFFVPMRLCSLFPRAFRRAKLGYKMIKTWR